MESGRGMEQSKIAKQYITRTIAFLSSVLK